MKSIIVLIIGITILASCKKQHDDACIPVKATDEAASIATYCHANGITYTVDSNGIYYQVIDPGSGAKPNINSTIKATYSTTLLTGQIVDTSHTTDPITLPLSQFIEGWRIAIPYIQQGGHIKIVIPSALAYGCTGIQNVVPANAPLYYDVLLLNVSN